MRFQAILRAVPVLWIAAVGAAGAMDASSCVACHTELDDSLAAAWERDAHRVAGLGCASCHGGDSSPELAEDMDAAMSEASRYRPAPSRLDVPEFCARCHSDAAFMKQYDPQARVDQLTEYRTSVHGQRNAGGDPEPAICIDCHGAHGVLPVTSPESPVYPANVPATCGACHADVERMARYGTPTNQYEDYRASVHGTVLLELGDIAAPACNDCHGNHGAAPPGVQSVAFVCGQCHGREAALFRASFKKQLFDDLGEAECTVCHGYHRILHPTPELFHGGTAPEATGEILSSAPLTVAFGDLPEGGRAEATWIGVLRPRTVDGGETFVHRVEVAAEGRPPLVIDATVLPGDDAERGTPRQVAAEGLTAVLSAEPTTGWPLEAGDAVRFRVELVAEGGAASGVVLRDLPTVGLDPLSGSACLTCHSPGDACDAASEEMYQALLSLERDLKTATAILHTAEVSGMEVQQPQFELKSRGRTASVEARALIHSFDPARLIARTEEGREVAAEAVAAGEGALAELQFRRKGLGVSLVLVALVLLGLFLKIRQIDRVGSTAGRPDERTT